MSVPLPEMSHACLRVGKKRIHIAISLTPRGRRQTLPIAIKAAIAHGTVVAATFDAERVIPGLSRIRHQTDCSDSNDREGWQEESDHLFYLLDWLPNARRLQAFPPVGNKVQAGSLPCTDDPLRLLTSFIGFNSRSLLCQTRGQPLWWRKPGICGLNESTARADLRCFRPRHDAAC